jgi:hypothetical protein
LVKHGGVFLKRPPRPLLASVDSRQIYISVTGLFRKTVIVTLADRNAWCDATHAKALATPVTADLV